VRCRHHQCRYACERSQPPGEVAAFHRRKLLHHDRRGVGQVVPEERGEPLGFGIRVDRAKHPGWIDQLQKRPPPRRAGADARSHAHPDQPRRERVGHPPVREGAQQRQAADPPRIIQRQLQRDQSAHRVADHMRPLNAGMIKHGPRIIRHLIDRQRPIPGRQALADPAVVEGDAPKRPRQMLHLRPRPRAMHADALDQQHGRTSTVCLAGDRTTPMLKRVHAAKPLRSIRVRHSAVSLGGGPASSTSPASTAPSRSMRK
jgi:hypothetical protein